MGKSVTAFKDLGKACSDLLTKDYKVKTIVDLKTTTPNGIVFKPTGTKSGDKFTGDCTATYDFGGGVELEAKVDTASVFSATLEAADNIVKGLKLTLDYESSDKALVGVAKCTADYKTDAINAKCTYDYTKSIAGIALTTAYQSLTMGCTADYNLTKAALKKYGAACTFVQPDYVVTAKMADELGKDGQVYSCSYYHKLSGDMQVGGELEKKMSKSDVGLTFGMAYKLDKDTTVKSKVDSAGHLFASYKQKISKLTTMTLAADIDTVNLNGNKHKFGMVINLTP